MYALIKAYLTELDAYGFIISSVPKGMNHSELAILQGITQDHIEKKRTDLDIYKQMSQLYCTTIIHPVQVRFNSEKPPAQKGGKLMRVKAVHLTQQIGMIRLAKL